MTKSRERGRKHKTGPKGKIAKKTKSQPKVVIKAELKQPAKGANKVTPSLRAAMPFPCNPEEEKAAMEYKDSKVYTDMVMGSWRIKQFGQRKNRSASFKAGLGH